MKKNQHLVGRPEGRPPRPVRDPWPAEESFAGLDLVLLEGYEPGLSVAWPGAAPEARGCALVSAHAQLELDLCPPIERLLDEIDSSSGRPFVSRGFTVRRISGPGSPSLVEAFCAKHHYLVGAGMNGERFGLWTAGEGGAGELVGVAVFAPCSNSRTARGMRIPVVPEDRELSSTERAHVWFDESQYRDCVRLCLADETAAGEPLGTGAESFFYAACLRYYLRRNRMLWRSHRLSELLAAPVRIAGLPPRVARVGAYAA